MMEDIKILMEIKINNKRKPLEKLFKYLKKKGIRIENCFELI